MMKWTFAIFVFFVPHSTICAQQISSSAGIIISNSAGNMSAVYGQVTFMSFGNTANISMGVLQVYIKRPVLYKPVTIKTAIVTAWPNPVKDYLFIKIDGVSNLQISYQVHSLYGQLIANEKVYTNTFSIRMQNYKSGIYIVTVISGYQNNATFKIIKL